MSQDLPNRLRIKHKVRLATTAFAVVATIGAVAYAAPGRNDSASEQAFEATPPSTALSAETVKASGVVAEPIVAATNSDSATPTPSPLAETTTPTPSARPSMLVAASEKGRLVVIDTTTGKTTRVLGDYSQEGVEQCFGLRDRVSLSPDGKVVYFEVEAPFGRGSDGQPSCRTMIHGRSTDGSGDIDGTIAEGMAPEISPDGLRLAYFRPAGPEDVNNVGFMVIRDLATGNELIFDNVDCYCGAPLSSWAPDNRHFAYQEMSCGCGGREFLDLMVLDTQNPEAPRVPVKVPSSIAEKAAWGAASYLPDGNLFVLEVPDSEYDQTNGFVRTTAPRMLIVDPTTGKVVKVVATGFADRRYTSTDADRTGDHLLYVSDGNLMVSDHGARPVKLATGLLGADW